jgi:hypothetical protein
MGVKEVWLQLPYPTRTFHSATSKQIDKYFKYLIE